MGQQANSSFFNPCVARHKDLGGERQRLDTCLKRADAFIAHPEKLEGECNLHFNRAGLDANGDMRRIELRRLLWTIAHGLGSTELTWEAIEDAAVVGTLEPQVPVVTRAEFFRCVLKTVHLVVAELQRKIDHQDAFMHFEVEQRGGREAAQAEPTTPDDQKPINPWAALAEQHVGNRSASSSSASSGASSSGDDNNDDKLEEELHEVDSQRLAKGGGKGRKGKFGKRGKWNDDSSREEQQPPGPPPVSCHGFSPAPGGFAGDSALVNGMTAMLLSCEGAFEPQRLFVDRGIVVLSDPDKAEPSLAQSLMCADGRTAFDLSLLEVVICGAAVARSPAAALLPDFAIRGRNAEDLRRLLVLVFDESEVLCLWFSAAEDCDLFRHAVLLEAPDTPTVGSPDDT